VQPFGNNLTTITLTGAQLHTMLKQQFCGLSNRRVLQPSDTVRYTYDPAKAVVGAPCATAPDDLITSFTIKGQPVLNDGSQTFRTTVNSFLADGGDGFSVLPTGTNRVGGEVDTKALEDYIAPSLTGTPISPPATTRALLDMFWPLKGATSTPWRANHRINPVATRLLPADDVHPSTISGRMSADASIARDGAPYARAEPPCEEVGLSGRRCLGRRARRRRGCRARRRRTLGRRSGRVRRGP